MDALRKLFKGGLGMELKTLATALKTTRTMIFAYGFMFAFISCTALIAFNSSGNASLWLSNIFWSRSGTDSSSSSLSSSSSSSQLSSFFSYIFPQNQAPTSAKLDDSLGMGSSGNVFAGKSDVSPSPAPIPARFHQDPGIVIEKSEGAPSSSLKTVRNGSDDGRTRSHEAENGKVSAEKEKVSVEEEKTKAKHEKVPAQKGKVSTEKGKVSGEKGEKVSSEKGKVSTEKGKVSGEKGEKVSSEKGKVSNEKEKVSAKKGKDLAGKGEGLAGRNGGNSSATSNPAVKATVLANKTLNQPGKVGEFSGNETLISKTEGKDATNSSTVHKGKGGASNFTSVLVKKDGGKNGVAANDGRKNSSPASDGRKKLDDLRDCDLFDGKWVKDDSYPLYPAGSCPHIDESFNCFLNQRPDNAYEKLRWQPKKCSIPRLNGTDFLRRLRGKRLVFVGDSLNRNMWESLVCTLRHTIADKSRVYEASGRREFRTEGFYAFRFIDYNCSVEFVRSPFLVQEWEIPEPNGTMKETLRLDIIENSASKYKNADIIVFNTGHWWTHEKTSRGKDYYQEGNHVYGELNVVDAYRKALKTWAKWVDINVNPKKTQVFFRGYSASHFSGGQWNSGGQCHKETEPIYKEKYLTMYPPKMRVLESVMREMKTPVFYLNITRMTDYRKDAHPSVYRKKNLTPEERTSPERFQDCSHWCLPGVPDIWNELLYAAILKREVN
ncbi:hypothetical protein AMTR_s00024p00162030 [Amborella trichopoda]|uniref:Uncharacterized protein n=2 Tax=Amborella trichopoda TaxID=13333 RepID=W1PSV1_AMBTC|nr:hypothetical protein AMTR_s00024p00162030 [Amborella trichopoda]